MRDSDARLEQHWARLRQLSCGISRKALTGHTVHRGSTQHMPPRTLVGSVMMKEACPSADLQCEKQEIDELEEGVRAYCARGEYVGCSPSSPVQEDTAVPGTVVQDCQQSEPVESPGALDLGCRWSGLAARVPATVP